MSNGKTVEVIINENEYVEENQKRIVGNHLCTPEEAKRLVKKLKVAKYANEEDDAPSVDPNAGLNDTSNKDDSDKGNDNGIVLPEGEPSKSWKVPQIKKFIELNEIPVEGKLTEKNMLAAFDEWKKAKA